MLTMSLMCRKQVVKLTLKGEAPRSRKKQASLTLYAPATLKWTSRTSSKKKSSEKTSNDNKCWKTCSPKINRVKIKLLSCHSQKNQQRLFPSQEILLLIGSNRCMMTKRQWMRVPLQQLVDVSAKRRSTGTRSNCKSKSNSSSTKKWN